MHRVVPRSYRGGGESFQGFHILMTKITTSVSHQIRE